MGRSVISRDLKMKQVARYVLVIALAGGGTYFISNNSSDINRLEMEVTRWRAHSESLENELALLRQESIAHTIASAKASEKSCEKSPLKKVESEAGLKSSTVASMSSSKQVGGGKRAARKVLDNQALDNLLLNGDLEKALASVRNDLDPEKRLRLLTALSKLKNFSVLEQSTQYQASDPEYLRSRIDRSIRILEVNRVFEDELGIGISQFLNEIDPSAVEDVSNK